MLRSTPPVGLTIVVIVVLSLLAACGKAGLDPGPWLDAPDGQVRINSVERGQSFTVQTSTAEQEFTAQPGNELVLLEVQTRGGILGSDEFRPEEIKKAVRARLGLTGPPGVVAREWLRNWSFYVETGVDDATRGAGFMGTFVFEVTEGAKDLVFWLGPGWLGSEVRLSLDGQVAEVVGTSKPAPNEEETAIVRALTAEAVDTADWMAATVVALETEIAVKLTALPPVVTPEKSRRYRELDAGSAMAGALEIKPSESLDYEGDLVSVAYSPARNMLAGVAPRRRVVIWDLNDEKRPFYWLDSSRQDAVVAFSPDGNRLATGGKQIPTMVWDTTTGDVLYQMGDEYDLTSDVAFSRDGSILAIANALQRLQLWDLRTGTELESLEPLLHREGARAVSFSPSDRYLASLHSPSPTSHVLRLWDTDERTELWSVFAHDDRAATVDFSPDSQLLVTGSDDGTARLWDVESGSLQQEIVHDGPVASVAFAPHGRTLATSSADTILVWDVAAELAEFQLLAHEDDVIDLGFSADGDTLVSVSEDKTIKLWPLAPDEQVREAPPPERIVASDALTNAVAVSPTAIFEFPIPLSDMALSPRGGLLAVSGHGYVAVRSLDVDAASQIVGRDWFGAPLMFYPDGSLLATAADTLWAVLWDVETWKVVREFGEFRKEKVQVWRRCVQARWRSDRPNRGRGR